MRAKGKIRSWNDQKGYGFITPFQSEKRLFIHISEFENRDYRPKVGEVVTYTVSSDKQGRPCATKATVAGDRVKEKPKRNTGLWPIAVPIGFLIVVSISVFFASTPPILLAGYLAAGMTETGVLGTWTGFVGPVVLSFMDGFYTGAMEYNKVHDTEVTVLGYDPADMDNAANIASWDDTDKGRAISETQMDNGADIIYGVCGNVSTAAAAAMQERGYGYIFGMDQDWTLTNPQYADQILGSALKNMHVAVHEIMKGLETDGSFAGGTDYVLTLANGGTSLELNAALDLPADLVAEVEALADQLAAGEITGASEEFYTAYRTK